MGISSPPFSDATALVKGSIDATKLLRFEIDGFTAGATRVITPPDSNITLAGINLANAWADGVKQTFNPDGTNAGINVGSNAVDPSAPSNGDLWYQSTANALRARINGATVDLGAGGGASPPFDDGTAIIKGSADATKLLRIEVDGFTAATTRVATPPNQNFTMAGLEVQQTFTQRQTITPPVNTSSLVVSGYSLTGANNQPLLDLSGTWNTSGVPSAIKLDITDTASDGGSLLLQLLVGGVEKFVIKKTGAFVMAGGLFSVESDGAMQVNSGTFSVAADGSFAAAALLFQVATDGSFSASGSTFLVNASGNPTVASQITFSLSAFTITDNGTELETSSALKLGGYLQLNNAAVAEVIVPDSTLIIRDSTGAEYKVHCVAV